MNAEPIITVAEPTSDNVDAAWNAYTEALIDLGRESLLDYEIGSNLVYGPAYSADTLATASRAATAQQTHRAIWQLYISLSARREPPLIPFSAACSNG